MDVGSKTDAFCIIYQINGQQQRRLGQTEVVADSLNPDFVTAVNIDYFFEEQQNIRVDVYDADDATQLNNLNKQEFIGSFNFQLGKLISARNQEITGQIESSVRKNSGNIKIMALEKKSDYGKT